VESKNALGAAKLSGGSASFATSTPPAGTHPIKAVYGGDASFIGSTSKVVNQVVSKATDHHNFGFVAESVELWTVRDLYGERDAAVQR
jgi:hypothetical protein